MAQNMVQTAASLNKNSFWQHPHATPFCINNNLRENRFFGQGERLADKKGTQNVKFRTENKTKQIRLRTREKETETESR